MTKSRVLSIMPAAYITGIKLRMGFWRLYGFNGFYLPLLCHYLRTNFLFHPVPRTDHCLLFRFNIIRWCKVELQHRYGFTQRTSFSRTAIPLIIIHLTNSRQMVCRWNWANGSDLHLITFATLEPLAFSDPLVEYIVISFLFICNWRNPKH